MFDRRGRNLPNTSSLLGQLVSNIPSNIPSSHPISQYPIQHAIQYLIRFGALLSVKLHSQPSVWIQATPAIVPGLWVTLLLACYWLEQWRYRLKIEHCSIGILRVSGCLERWAQKLAIMVVNSEHAVNALFAFLAELFDTRLRIFTRDATRRMHFVIPTSMKRWCLPKQHWVNVHVPRMGEWTPL